MNNEVNKSFVENEKYSNKLPDSQSKILPKNEVHICKTIFLIILIMVLFVCLCYGLFFLHYGPKSYSLLLANHRIAKPIIDERVYRIIKLKNGLDVLIIHDDKITTSAASISVGVGSLREGEINGLAHFLEHMLFLGSISYPSPNVFDKLLSDNFGNSNAFTEDEKTTYHFEVNSRVFKRALDMFSKMFTEPLFDKDRMNKEIQSVDSEHEKNLNNDNWRENQILKNISNKNHAFSQFSTGSKKTLSAVNDNVLLNNMIKLYDNYYTPRNMRLTILSNKNIIDLEKIADKYFGSFKENITQNQTYLYGSDTSEENPYYNENLGKIIWYKKISELINLDLVFAVDSLIPKYKTKPYEYLNYMIVFPGKDSLIYHLKNQNLALKIEAGILMSISKLSQYSISITLTDEGLNKVDEVINMVFQYINLIIENGVSKIIFKELQNINDSKFNFLEKSGYGTYVSSLASGMFDYDYTDILKGEFILNTFNKTEIMSFIDSLKIDKCIIVIGSKKNPNMNIKSNFFTGSSFKKEKWYGTTFLENKLNESYMNKLGIVNETVKTKYKLRQKNLFISKINNPTICKDTICFKEGETITPSIYYESNKIKIYFKRDVTFKVPRIYSNMQFYIKSLRTTPLDHLITTIFINYIDRALDSLTADIKDSGNDIVMTIQDNGISLQINCYSDLIERIYKIVLDKIFSTTFNKKAFIEATEVTNFQILQDLTSKPKNKYANIISRILQENITDSQQEINLIGKVTFEKFQNMVTEIKKDIFSVGFFYGDVDEHHLKSIKNSLINHMNKTITNSQTVKIETQIDRLLSVRNIESSTIYRIKNSFESEINHFVGNIFQVGYKTPRNFLLSSLLDLTWGSTFYYELRTVKQLGYIVDSGIFRINSIMYLNIFVQGSKMTPDKMNVEIDIVLKLLKDNLFKLTEIEFEDLKKSLKIELEKPKDNLQERFQDLVDKIETNTFLFNEKEILINELKNISLKDAKSFYNKIFISNPKKLSIQIFAGTYKDKLSYKSEKYHLDDKIEISVTDKINILEKNKFITKELLIMTKSIKNRLK